MAWLPLTKWRNNSFLSSSNHTMIISLLFLSFMCHESYQSIFLYFAHQYLFPFEYLSISFWVMLLIMSISLPFVDKRTKKGNNSRDWLRRLEKEWRKETIAVIDGGGSGGYTQAGKNGVGEKKQWFSVETISSTSFFPHTVWWSKFGWA
jgi:predicted membrane protein